MKFASAPSRPSSTLLLSSLLAVLFISGTNPGSGVLAKPIPALPRLPRAAAGVPDAATIAALAPQFGFESGVNPTGTGDCDGAVNDASGKPIKIPCSCPPDRNTFIQDLVANVQAGHVTTNPSVTFTYPTDSSAKSQIARLQASIDTLQNLHAAGVGCPVVSTTFQAQIKALQNGAPPPPPPVTLPNTVSRAATSTSTKKAAASTAATPPPAAPPPAATNQVAQGSGSLSAATIAALAPQFGFESGINPTGTGDCDGAVNDASGKPIKIPCACPPDRNTFIQDLVANVEAGHVTTNPTVKLTYPTDSSAQSQIQRLQASIDTLQNLHAAGVGCPVVSTTFQAQIKALQNGSPPPPPVTLPNTVSHAATSTKKAVVAATTAAPPPAKTNQAVQSSGSGALSAATIAALAPQFGFESGINPTGTGDCDGAVNDASGKPIKIPCACPPDRNTFIQDLVANVQAGHVVTNPSVTFTYPTDSSAKSQIARLQASIDTLQNLHAAGVGCPVVSTTFQAQIKALQNGSPPPPPVTLPNTVSHAATSTKKAAAATSAPAAASTPASSPSSSSGTPSNAQIAALAPPLGFHSGVNPTGTGDCDGAVNGSDGKPIKVPCSCPPDQATYIAALEANVQAGHAIHNTGVRVTFPVDNSKQSQAARVEAAIVTLQNLNGPGVGCPVVSTTLGVQQKALQK